MVVNLSSIPLGCDCSFSDLNKELKGKDKLITKMQNNMKSYEVKLRLHNIVHFPHLTAVEIIYPEHIHEYSQSIVLLCKEMGK
jgi:hypothetical protein